MSQPTAVRRRAVNPWWVGFVAGMASFLDGAAVTGNAFALVIYQHTIGLTPTEIGVLTSVLTFGVAIGALVGGRLGDRFGRRRVFIATMVLVVAGGLLPMLATSFWPILAGLSVLGLAVGADIPVSLATIAEAASDTNRGKILVLSNLLWGIGIGATVLVTSLTAATGRFGAQAIYGLVVVVGLVVLLLRLTIPESTSWITARDERRRGVLSVRAQTVHLRDLLQRPLRFPFLVLAGFFTLVSVPIQVFGSYVAYIGANYGGVPVATFSVVILLGLPLAVIAQVFFMRIIDTRFRLTFFLAGGVLFVVGYLVPVLFGINLTTLVAAVFLAGLGTVFCGEPIFRVWANEAFPTMLRGTAQGFLFGLARIVPAVLLAPVPALIAASPTVFFITLSVLAAAGVAIGWGGFHGNRVVNEFDHEDEPVDAELAAA
ncbi:MAG TPA: MFS transporter [Leifsonia sp.]